MPQARLAFLPRDHEVLVALARGPLLAEQLFRLSATFSRPFRDLRRARERLGDLAGAGLVCRWPIASEAGSGRIWYTLGKDGESLLFGADNRRSRPERRRPFSIARARHTYHLSEFVLRTVVASHQCGAVVTGFGPEGTVRFAVGEEVVIPDASFVLQVGDRSFQYVLEIDEATECLQSKRDVETLERKLRLYEAYQDLTIQRRFRVLVATTGGPGRVANILALAKSQAKNVARSLILATTLTAFFQSETPLAAPIFMDHRGESVSVIPTQL